VNAARWCIPAALLIGIVTGCGPADEARSGSGTRVVLEASGFDGQAVKDGDLERAVEVLSKRLDKVGLHDAKVERTGETIQVELPDERKEVLPALIRPGRLELYDLQGDLVEASKDAQGFPLARTSKPNVPPNAVLVTCGRAERYCPGVMEEPSKTYFYVFRYEPADDEHPIPEMTGTDFKPESIRQEFDSTVGEPIVFFDFTPKGGRKFQKVTRELAKRGQRLWTRNGGEPEIWSQQFAIVLDREIRSAPTIDFRDNPVGIPPDNGAQITGIGSLEEARELALVLQTGALPVALKPVE
jgi:preprotein translocase subunit SecD